MLSWLINKLAVTQEQLALAGILAIAAGLRFWGLSFGLPHDLCSPDEAFMVHHSLSIGAGDLNPHAFYYPTLHFYLLAVTFGAYFVSGYAIGMFSSLQDFELSFFLDPSPLYLLGRSLSACFGTVSVWIVYRIGRLLGDHRAGCISAAFLAICFLHVRDSHFSTPDVPATCYFLASCALALRYTQTNNARDIYLGSVFLGLAASTKYNLGLFAITILLAGLHNSAPMRQTIRRLFIAIGSMATAFIVASPFIILDFTTFWRDINALSNMVAQGGITDLGRGWLYYPWFTLPHSLGWPLFVVGLAGTLRWMLRLRLTEIALLVGLIGYYAIAGSGKAVYFRYTIPMLPILCLAAGLFVNALARTWTHAMLLTLLIAVPTAWSSYSHGLLLTQVDTRLLAARWIEDQIPANAKIARCCSASLFGHPQLRLNTTAAKQRMSEQSQTGNTFRRWQYLQAIEDNNSKPGYDIVELRRSDHSGYSWIWSKYDIDRLRREQVEWVIIQEHPHIMYSNVDAPFAASLATHVVKTFDPFLGTTNPLYDRLDAYYLPVAGFDGVSRPGPKISIYHLKTP